MAAAPPAVAPPAAPPVASVPVAAAAVRATAAAAPASPATPAPSPAAGLFDDLDDAEFDVDVEASAPSLAAPPLAAPAPAEGPWPIAVPGTAEAADALDRGLLGVYDPPGTALGAVADVVDVLTDLERAAFSDEPLAVDVGAIRRAAVMRVRVAAALATAPAPGSTVDGGAVSALLAELDGLLSEIGTLAQSAPPELQPGLEQIRNALVKEAIDFSEAAHRASPSEPIPADAPAAPRGKAAQTRIVAVASKAEQELDQAEAKRHRVAYVILACAAVLALGYHGYRWSGTRGTPDAVRLSSLPSARVLAPPTGALPGQPVMLRSEDGRPFTPEEVKRLSDEEALKGNTVREAGPGVLMILPAVAGSAGPPLPQR
jgi:hypothetical protein